ncbi:hypothetical protein DPX16_20054 [Anabarilius grahami]|uniref:Uncharacterized protein n=1 Tax=Anabarilius grahami TaxID=495550 RepID=A0A3N0XRD6_ANAGA|nr:hypothetical protein DPX16_20054 [Anabarilius grahami]
MAFFFHEGVWSHSFHGHLFPGGPLKNPGHPVEFNQSDDDFKTLEVFPDKCSICIESSANGYADEEPHNPAVPATPVHIMPATPGPVPVMPAKPEPVYVMAATPGPVHFMPAKPEPVHVMPANSEFLHDMAATQEPLHKMATPPVSSDKMAAPSVSSAKMAATPE